MIMKQKHQIKKKSWKCQQKYLNITGVNFKKQYSTVNIASYPYVKNQVGFAFNLSSNKCMIIIGV